MPQPDVQQQQARLTPDPIPGRIREVIDLFEGELSGIVFPQVDQHRLEEQATAARELAAELARLEAQVAHRSSALREALVELEATARRGVAYARVYADGDDGLERRLEGLELAKPAAPARQAQKAPRKGRRRQAQAEVEQHTLLEAS